MNKSLSDTDFVKKIIKLSKDYDSKRGVFYHKVPSSDYLSCEQENLVTSFVSMTPVFHFFSLINFLRTNDPDNCPSNQVVAAYLVKKGFSKTKVPIPSSKSVNLWAQLTNKIPNP